MVENFLPHFEALCKQRAAMVSLGQSDFVAKSKAESKILVVEDNKAISTLLKYVLKSEGYTVEIADTTQAAQAIVDDRLHHFCLILLDLNLPGGSGFDILDALPKENRAPVIILSALSQSQNVIRGLESGAVDYLTKPFNPQELILRIKKAIA